ncbi:hypothetical protein MTP99_002597 [Tenebrio molitor]|nr:hypothetical protein MTP99_002597 [Tenebrio molitor]
MFDGVRVRAGVLHPLRYGRAFGEESVSFAHVLSSARRTHGLSVSTLRISCSVGALYDVRTDAGASSPTPTSSFCSFTFRHLAHLRLFCAYVVADSDLCRRKVNARRLLITRYIRPETRPSELPQDHHALSKFSRLVGILLLQ